MNKDLKIGDEVYLSSSHNWIYGSKNPLTCSGKVIGEDVCEEFVLVKWDNKHENGYEMNASDLISKIQPSRDIARVAARRNPNLTVVREDGKWVLKLKDKLVINDGGK